MKNRLYNIIRKRGLEKLRANIILTTQWFDLKGNPTSREQVSDSLTGNFLLFLYTNFAASPSDSSNWPYAGSPFLLNSSYGSYYIPNTAGAVDAGSETAAVQKLNAGSGDNSFGILYSTDTAAPGISDSVPAGVIANGNGAGQLAYQAQISSQLPTYVGNTGSFKIYRAVTNNSGASITAEKIYIVVYTGGYKYITFEELNNHTINDAATEGLRITFTVTV